MSEIFASFMNHAKKFFEFSIFENVLYLLINVIQSAIIQYFV